MHDPDAQARVPLPAFPRSVRGSAPPAEPLGRATIALHWSVGLAVIALLAYGFWLQTLPSGPDKAPLVQLHKSFGLLVLVVALTRLLWRWRQGFPTPASPHALWERRAARTLHAGMLAATILMPVSGILRSLAYGRPVALFNVTLIPKLFEAKQDQLYALASNLHDGLAIALSIAILIHVAAALRHHLALGDATLRRMLGR